VIFQKIHGRIHGSSLGRTTDKFAINWQNVAQVGLLTRVCF